MIERPGERGEGVKGERVKPGPLFVSEVICYPELIDECAEVIGVKRNEANKGLHGVKKFCRGDKNDAVDILGVKGELLYRYFLFLKDRPFVAAKLYDDKPVRTWDVLLMEGRQKSVDVKVVPEGGSEFRVNCQAHEKKVVDWYVFARLMEGRRVQFIGAPYRLVGEWEVKEGQYGAPYYAKRFSNQNLSI